MSSGEFSELVFHLNLGMFVLLVYLGEGEAGGGRIGMTWVCVVDQRRFRAACGQKAETNFECW